MEGRKGTIRVALCENLRELTKKGLFEKITIKRICDETGVIRATFYNHFDDKYDCLNTIVYKDIVESSDIHTKFQNNSEVFRAAFTNIEEERDFYRMAWQVTGQNSFEEMVKDNFRLLLVDYFNQMRNTYVLPEYSNDILAQYYASSLTFLAHLMIFDRKQYTTDQILIMMNEIMTHSLSELLVSNH